MTVTDRWQEAKAVIGGMRVTLGPQASQQWTDAPEHLAMVLARYRAAAALIGGARSVLEVGCGEGIGAGILAKGREYRGYDPDAYGVSVAQRMGVLAWDRFTHDALPDGPFDAAVSLDVIEHVPAEDEASFLAGITDRLTDHGVCVIGTPNAAFDHLASPQSKAGHVNTYTHARLHALMSRYFHVVQSFGMQDTGLHLGHPDARHYLLLCGIGPRRGEGA